MNQAVCPAVREDELVWRSFNRRTNGFFVEVGANEPQQGSQTWLLEQRGWRGILVEPLPQYHARLETNRPGSRLFKVACGPAVHAPAGEFFESATPAHSSFKPHAVDAQTEYVRRLTVPILSLNEILAEAGSPKVDFVSIDVEGAQLDVLEGFDLGRHRPGLLLIEDHLRSLSCHHYLRKQKYRLVKRTGLNNWYIPQDEPFSLVVEDYSAALVRPAP